MARFNQNYSLFLFIPITMAFIGMLWLALNDIDAGQDYTLLFLGSIAFMSLILLFVDEHSRKSVFGYIGLPFSTSTGISVWAYVVGLLIPIILFFIFSLNTSALAVPFAAGDINSAITTQFSALSISESPFWELYTTVFTAGTIEELMFGVVTMLVGGLLTAAILGLLGVNLGRGSGTVVFIGGLLFSVASFMFIHRLNDSYITPSFFIAAGVFRLLMNIGIYSFALFLSFSVGFHQSNNAIWYIDKFGLQRFYEAMGSNGGILWIFLIVVFLAAIVQLPYFDDYFKGVLRSRRRV